MVKMYIYWFSRGLTMRPIISWFMNKNANKCKTHIILGAFKSAQSNLLLAYQTRHPSIVQAYKIRMWVGHVLIFNPAIFIAISVIGVLRYEIENLHKTTPSRLTAAVFGDINDSIILYFFIIRNLQQVLQLSDQI